MAKSGSLAIDAVPLAVYDTTPEQQQAAALYVCGRLPKPAAVEVLQALGLIPTPVSPDQRPRDPLGKPYTSRAKETT